MDGEWLKLLCYAKLAQASFPQKFLFFFLMFSGVLSQVSWHGSPLKQSSEGCSIGIPNQQDRKLTTLDSRNLITNSTFLV